MTTSVLNFYGKGQKAKKKKEPKLPFGITPEFDSEVQSAATEELNAKIVTIQKQLDEVITFLKTNEKLRDLREAVKEAEGPSKDTKKSLNNRTKLILDILKGRGVA